VPRERTRTCIPPYATRRAPAPAILRPRIVGAETASSISSCYYHFELDCATGRMTEQTVLPMRRGFGLAARGNNSTDHRPARLRVYGVPGGIAVNNRDS
jgi:hypothetical protein